MERSRTGKKICYFSIHAVNSVPLPLSSPFVSCLLLNLNKLSPCLAHAQDPRPFYCVPSWLLPQCSDHFENLRFSSLKVSNPRVVFSNFCLHHKHMRKCSKCTHFSTPRYLIQHLQRGQRTCIYMKYPSDDNAGSLSTTKIFQLKHKEL